VEVGTEAPVDLLQQQAARPKPEQLELEQMLVPARVIPLPARPIQAPQLG
jgi:hypothetical protein